MLKYRETSAEREKRARAVRAPLCACLTAREARDPAETPLPHPTLNFACSYLLNICKRTTRLGPLLRKFLDDRPELQENKMVGYPGKWFYFYER